MKIRTTAKIVRGVTTNRVRVKRRASKSAVTPVAQQPRPPRPSMSAQTTITRYRQDPLVRCMDTAVISICMPVTELIELDAFAARVQMARSHLVRQAVKHFRAKVAGK